MSVITKAIHDFLRADAGIEAAVIGRVHEGRLPKEKKLPAIVLTAINTDHHYELANESTVRTPTVQVDVYDSDPQSQHEVIAELVRSRLSGYQGPLNESIRCDCAVIVRDSELPEAPKDASDNWIRRTSLDFRIHYFAAAPAH